MSEEDRDGTLKFGFFANGTPIVNNPTGGTTMQGEKGGDEQKR
jgi:hypothetical protein